MSKLPMDPWGNVFHYIPDCAAKPQTFSIIMLGEHGKPSPDDRVFSFAVKRGADGKHTLEYR